MASEIKKRPLLKTLSIWMIVFLIIQYILGMISNLFVSFPDSGGEGAMWEFAWKQMPIALHIISGSLLLIGSIIILIMAFKSKIKNWKTIGIIGFVSILIAGFSGARFIPTQNDVFSFIMSFAFISALLCYMWGLIS